MKTDNFIRVCKGDNTLNRRWYHVMQNKHTAKFAEMYNTRIRDMTTDNFIRMYKGNNTLNTKCAKSASHGPKQFSVFMSLDYICPCRDGYRTWIGRRCPSREHSTAQKNHSTHTHTHTHKHTPQQTQCREKIPRWDHRNRPCSRHKHDKNLPLPTQLIPG